MAETKLPGIKSAHRIVTPVCRENKGRFAPAEEAANALVRKYAEYSKDDGGHVNWHFVLVREDT